MSSETIPDHKRIWLQPFAGDDGGHTWCPERIEDDDIEYIRLDVHEAALLAAERRGEEKKAAEIEALLKDPVAVRANYLRGGIACQPLIDEAEQRGLEKAAEVALIRSPDDDSLDWQVRQQVAAAIRSLGEKT